MADLAVVDDGSPVTGEVMNLLVRRNLLFEIVKAPSAKYPLNVAIGSPGTRRRRPPTRARSRKRSGSGSPTTSRSLRIYGSEVVIGRLTADSSRARLQLLNYGGREIEGLRIRVKGAWKADGARVTGADPVNLSDVVVGDGFTEFSMPRLTTYAAIDFNAAK